MAFDPHVDLLPYPLKPLDLGDAVIEEYIIPNEARAELLAQLHFFKPVPRLTAWRLDLHTGRKFQVRDYRVLRHGGRNWLFTPFVEEGGGSVIDWVPTAPPRRARKEESGSVSP